MANYAITNSTGGGVGQAPQALTTTYKSIIICGVGSSVSVFGSPSGGVIQVGTARRGKIYDILVGTMSVPADTAIQWSVQRITTIGTSSVAWGAGAVTSLSSTYCLDTADGVAQSVLIANSSTEASVTAGSELWNVGLNQRASYRWVAAPGSEMVYPATSSNGLALRAVSSVGGYTGVVTATVLMQEQ